MNLSKYFVKCQFMKHENSFSSQAVCTHSAHVIKEDNTLLTHSRRLHELPSSLDLNPHNFI